MAAPAFSPQNDWVAFLKPVDGVSTLWRLHAATDVLERVVNPADGGDTEENLSNEEKLRRERTRQLATGITSFSVLSSGAFMLPQHGSVCTIAPGSDAVVVAVDCAREGACGGPCLDAKAWARDSSSPQFAAFVQDNELYVAALSVSGTAAATQVTFGAREAGCSHGLADYLAQEELDRYTGFWWSPDGAAIAFQHTDDTHIPEFRITHVGVDPASAVVEESHRYPFAGAANPSVKLGIVNVAALTASEGTATAAASFPVTWCDFGPNTDLYLGRVQWFNASRVLVQLLNRAQTVLDVVEFDTSGVGRLLLREQAPAAWINLHDAMTPVALFGTDADAFLWLSERDGFQHMYLYSRAASGVDVAAYAGVPVSCVGDAPVTHTAAVSLLGQLTAGAWIVESIAHVRVERGEDPSIAVLHVIFSGSMDDALQKHAYAVTARVTRAADGTITCESSAPMRLTLGAGTHSVTVSSNGKLLVDELSTLHTSPSVTVFEIVSPADAATSGTAAASTIDVTLPLRIADGDAPADGSTPTHAASTPAASTHAPLDVATIDAAIVDFAAFGRYLRRDAALRCIRVCHGALPPGGSVPDGHILAIDQLRAIAAGRGARRGAAAALSGALQRMVAPVVRPVSVASAALLESVSNAVSNSMDALSSGMDTVTNAVSSSMDAIQTGIAPLRKMSSAAQRSSVHGSALPAASIEDAYAAADAVIAATENVTSADVRDFLSPAASNVQIDAPAPAATAATVVIPQQQSMPDVAAAPVAPVLSPATDSIPLAPLIVRIPLPGTDTHMFGALFIPDASKHGFGPYPTVISVYGGPHVQRVRHSWVTTMDARAHALRKAGFLVALFDNRGSSRRGVAFEAALRHRMGSVEISDQCAGVDWLVRTGLSLPGVGIYGHSYGGYMSLMCLARAAHVFSVAVAGAPVTDWAGYDTAYTERYMSTPELNPDGYRDGCVMTHVAGIQGALLILHGLIDENVHARHTYRLIHALNKHDIAYSFVPYPCERHGIRTPAERAHMDRSTVNFFKRHLHAPASIASAAASSSTAS